MNGGKGKHPAVIPPIVLQGIVDRLSGERDELLDVLDELHAEDPAVLIAGLREAIEDLRKWVP